jgi:hypothetical protein
MHDTLFFNLLLNSQQYLTMERGLKSAKKLTLNIEIIRP